MKILLFLKSLATHWINAVSGTILAVVLTFGPNFISTQYLGWTQFTIVVLAILVACYLAWCDQYDEKITLTQKLKSIEDSTPKFAVKVVDENADTFDNLKQAVDEKLKSAKEKMRTAPAPHPFLPNIAMLGQQTSSDWHGFIDRLHIFEERLAVIKANAQLIINLEIENVGRVSDEAINMTIGLNDAQFLPNFYQDEIEIEMPSEPGLDFAFGGSGYQNKQGIKRETLEAGKTLLKLEINRMHPGERVCVSYDPLFLKITGADPKVVYEIRTKGLPSVTKGTLKL